MSTAFHIYAMQHNKTKRVYVGCAHNIFYRCKAHLSALKGKRHKSSMMQADFDRFGNDFSIWELETVPSDQRIQVGDHEYQLQTIREVEWMIAFDSIENGYNHQDKVARVISAKKAVVT